ncbi:MAG: PEP/pyruvate-binding domain-containing protein [Burkholderiaceae bacterium]
MTRLVALALADEEALFGGKSVQLGACLRGGLPVPPGWALSVEFVEAIVHGEASALDELESLLQGKSEPYAVRSSAVGEDAVGASFAGQHLTELNRRGLRPVVDAIGTIWNSGRSASASAYRERLGLLGAARMAVTLQKMVFPDCAGVMFTRHPVTSADEIVIEATWGLGEAIVEGLVIPDRFRLSKQGQLLEAQAGIKDICVHALPDGGIEQLPVQDTARVHDACLDAAQLAQLVQLARLCEEHFGPARDIEWGMQGGELFLLQCRAITSGNTS